MVHWIWLLVAVWVGAALGVAFMCLIQISAESGRRVADLLWDKRDEDARDILQETVRRRRME